MNTLFLIPARGGSKGVPGKNIRKLANKPLINYSIEFARKYTDDSNICVSSDDPGIIDIANQVGLQVPFQRPDALATDNAGTWEVIVHALDFYQNKGVNFDCVVLLQPTSPFRKEQYLKEALLLYSPELDMVVSVRESEANPYFNLFEENAQGLLYKCKETKDRIVRRQDAPRVYQYNGSIYVINVGSIKKYSSFAEFTKIKKVVMDSLYSIDIDTESDFEYCEFLLSKNKL
jgi:CMP-N,N'-diacetyllegionaminic acid synthase